MPQAPIENAGAKLTWIFSPDDWPELMQFGVHTGVRGSGDWDAMLDIMVDEFSRFGEFMPDCTGSRVVYSEWQTGPGFTGWHQKAARDVATDFGSGVSAPHQLAIVCGWVNLSEPDVALGRRRNRMFLGPLLPTVMVTATRLSGTQQAAVQTMLAGLHSDISALPADGAFSPVFDGLCVASPAEGVLLEGNQTRVGRRIDVHRSRADHVPESPSFEDL